MRIGLLQQPVQIILIIPMIRIFASILELYYAIVDLTLCFLVPHIDSVGNTIRHLEAGKFPTLQHSSVHQTKNLIVPLNLPVVPTEISG